MLSQKLVEAAALDLKSLPANADLQRAALGSVATEDLAYARRVAATCRDAVELRRALEAEADILGYSVSHTNGSPSHRFNTREEALESIRDRYGADVYVEQFEDRMLCWAAEADSVDDDGARALASIYEIRPE